MRAGARIIIIVAALAAPFAAAADPDTAAQRTEAARKLYTDGKSAYESGRYQDALREFSEGYRLSPRPEFLLNIAQSYNKLGRRAEAMAHYESFLAADPDSPFAATARANLAALRREPAASAPTASAPPTRVVPPRAPAPAAAISTAPVEKRRTGAWHLAWALPAAAAVITATAVGIYFGTRPASCDPKSCIDLSHGR